MTASRPRPFVARLGVHPLEDRLTPSWAAVPPALVPVPTVFADVTPDAAYRAAGTASVSTGEVDWYKVTVQPGTTTAAVTTPYSTVDTVIGLYNAAGLRVSYNNNQSTTITDSRLSKGLPAGTYYLGVTSLEGTAGLGKYSWALTTPPPDDVFEENDSQGTATDLGTVTAATSVPGLALADGYDWYKFTTTQGGVGSVSLSFLNARGNLALRLYDAAGAVLSNSSGTGDAESVSLAGRPAGTYWVRVGGEFNPAYTLTVTPPRPAAPGGGFAITLRTAGLTPSQEAVFQQAADRWAEVIVGDLPDASYLGVAVDDLLIDAKATAIDGRGGILGSAGWDALRGGSLLPYHGTMSFDAADLAGLEASGGLFYTVLHEMGHVLGVGTLWNVFGLLSGEGGADPRFTGARATAEYNALFGVSEAGVPVENTGGTGTRDAHWRESVFDNEVMTGWLDGGANPLSRVTAASMADLGYAVNIDAADPYTP